MATYNGAKFIKKQLQSILKQSYKNFDLIIRDDGSSDNTVAIIKRICNDPKENKNNIQVEILINSSDAHGQVKNFSELYKFAISKRKYEYIMFSDQDDLWLEDKVLTSLNEIHKFGNTPALLYTNYYVYNTATNEKQIAYKRYLPYSFEKMFVQNWTMGCTFIMNKTMIDIVPNIPSGVENHDYWLALNAALTNNLHYLAEPTMVHILHNSNVTAKANSDTARERVKRVYKEVLLKKGRSIKYIAWNSSVNALDLMYSDNSHIKKLKEVMHASRLKSILLANKYKYKGLNKRTTILFYLYLLLK